MPFKLTQREPIPTGIRRVVRERIGQALKALQKSRSVSDHAIHETRKRFKEVRGVLRLVRDELGENVFQRENHAFRDAGRPLSTLRDAKALVDALDGLLDHFHRRVEPDDFTELRRALLKRRRAARKRVLEHDHALAAVVKKIRSAGKRVERWRLEGCGWKAVELGLRKAYARGRRAMKDVCGNNSNDVLHEWRKRTKDLRYALELLQPVRSKAIKPRAARAHELTNLLGDDHDLSVLRSVAQEAVRGGVPVDCGFLFELIDKRRGSLQKKARELGRRFYAVSPHKFAGGLKDCP